MANGHGGQRAGSGRKPKAAVARALDGNANHKGRLLPHPSAVTPPPAAKVFDEADAPNDLSTDERNVWLELAAHATANGTLTDATSLAFRMLCRNIVLERQYMGSVADRGSANHRGLIQRVDAELLRFNLAPCGKPVAPVGAVEPAADPVKDKYFGGNRRA